MRFQDLEAAEDVLEQASDTDSGHLVDELGDWPVGDEPWLDQGGIRVPGIDG